MVEIFAPESLWDYIKAILVICFLIFLLFISA